MKNSLLDIQNHIVEMIEKMNDQDVNGDEAKVEIMKAMALERLAGRALENVKFLTKYASDNGIKADIPVFPEGNDKPKLAPLKK